jgi:hypothetical protein
MARWIVRAINSEYSRSLTLVEALAAVSSL